MGNGPLDHRFGQFGLMVLSGTNALIRTSFIGWGGEGGLFVCVVAIRSMT